MLSIVLALLPGRLHLWLRRRRGDSIAASATVGFGAVIQTESLTMGAHSHIGRFTRLRATKIDIGDEASVGSLTSVGAHTLTLSPKGSIAALVIVLGDSCNSRARLTIGRHSKIFPFCWVDLSHEVTLGDRVGVGGHGLIFTHGSWANHFLGAPVSFGPVVIEDRVWLPWRVTVLPGVTIGARAIVSTGAVVMRDVPRGALAGGLPAKTLREVAYTHMEASDIEKSLSTVAAEFTGAVGNSVTVHVDMPLEQATYRQGVVLTFGGDIHKAEILRASGIGVIDVGTETAWIPKDGHDTRELASWLTRYGVRVDER